MVTLSKITWSPYIHSKTNLLLSFPYYPGCGACKAQVILLQAPEKHFEPICKICTRHRSCSEALITPEDRNQPPQAAVSVVLGHGILGDLFAPVLNRLVTSFFVRTLHATPLTIFNCLMGLYVPKLLWKSNPPLLQLCELVSLFFSRLVG